MISLLISDRLYLLQLLQQAYTEGDILTLRQVRRMQDVLSFTEDEHALFELERTDTGYRWKSETERPINVEFGDKEREVLRGAFDKLDKAHKMTSGLLDVYDKIFPQP